jgi:chromate reductase
MYTIISATHRPGSNSLKVAHIYLQILQDQGIEAKLLSLTDLPHDFIFTNSFGSRTERFQQIVDLYISPARKFILVAPEYNGGMPGIFNAFVDAVTPDPFRGKKVAMVGVAAGRGGNVRGMDHQTNCFHYMGVNVYHQFVTLSQILSMGNKHGELGGEVLVNLLKKQALGFMAY